MKEIGIAKTIVTKRREKGITQDELASCMGVTKASVSKWETGQSYPDILLLPKLAAYFNVSIDELMDYTPQLTKDDIRRIYHQMATEFISVPFSKAKEKCEVYIQKYYSCFPFLLQMAILYVNHHMMAGSQENITSILEDAIKLCQRIQTESDDPLLRQKAVYIEAAINQILNRPERILELLGEEITPEMSGSQLIINAFQMLGNQQKARQLAQIYVYNLLGEQLSVMPTYMQLYKENLPRLEEIVRRICGMIDLFQAKKILANACALFYYNAAVLLMGHNQSDSALTMLEHYTSVCIKELSNVSLHGDDFFDLLDSWFEDLELGKQAPRSQTSINEDILAVLCQTDAFHSLENNKRYQHMVQTLKEL